MLADSASQISIDGYNAIRLKELGEELEIQLHELESIRSQEATNKALWAISSQAENDIDKFKNLLSSRASFEIKRSAGRTMYMLGTQDRRRPRFARVPGYSKAYGHGCLFCLMLASRGFVYSSAKAAELYGSRFDHYHPDCKCSIVPSWEKSTRVEGYHPKELEDEWRELRKQKEERARERQMKANNGS